MTRSSTCTGSCGPAAWACLGIGFVCDMILCGRCVTLQFMCPPMQEEQDRGAAIYKSQPLSTMRQHNRVGSCIIIICILEPSRHTSVHAFGGLSCCEHISPAFEFCPITLHRFGASHSPISSCLVTLSWDVCDVRMFACPAYMHIPIPGIFPFPLTNLHFP